MPQSGKKYDYIVTEQPPHIIAPSTTWTKLLTDIQHSQRWRSNPLKFPMITYFLLFNILMLIWIENKCLYKKSVFVHHSSTFSSEPGHRVSKRVSEPQGYFFRRILKLLSKTSGLWRWGNDREQRQRNEQKCMGSILTGFTRCHKQFEWGGKRNQCVRSGL